jgi:pterin-4a-carbinolamine dehydratase
MARVSDEESKELLSGLEGWQRDGEAIRRDNVTVTISTHYEGGLTENELELAPKVDQLA